MTIELTITAKDSKDLKRQLREFLNQEEAKVQTPNMFKKKQVRSIVSELSVMGVGKKLHWPMSDGDEVMSAIMQVESQGLKAFDTCVLNYQSYGNTLGVTRTN